MNTLRLLLISSAFSLCLSACNKDIPHNDTASTPPTAPAASNIVGQLNIVNYAEISATKAFIRITLTGTDKHSGASVNFASTLQTNLQTQNLSFTLPSPSVIDNDVNYGISLELVSGNRHPGFNAWYPLDLNHYNGELLSTRLFPLNSSTLINYQINALQCGSIKIELANDNATMWLNADGSGHFLTKTEDGSFANQYASINRATHTLSLGDETYHCKADNKASTLAKKRFSGAIFYAISRKDGWAITVYNRTLRLVSRRGLKTELKGLSKNMPLNDQWKLNSTDSTVSIARNKTLCDNGTQAINATIDGSDYTACGEKLR